MEKLKIEITDHDLLNNGEVNQLLGAGPSNLIVKGNILLLVLIVAMGFLAWYIKIPDTVMGAATLKPSQAVSVIKTVNDLTVQKILKLEGDIVKAGDTVFTANDGMVFRSDSAAKVLYLRKLSRGSTVKKGTQLVALLPVNQNIEVLTYVPVSDYSRIKLGQKAIISIVSEFNGLEKVTGHIEGIAIPKEGDKFGIASIKLDQNDYKLICDKPQILYAVKAFTSIVYGESNLINRLFKK